MQLLDEQSFGAGSPGRYQPQARTRRMADFQAAASNGRDRRQVASA
jgi:hypothetical protein